MTSFVHVDHPLVHPGVQRAEVLFGRFSAARYTGVGTRHLLMLLLLAVVAIAVVVADVLVSDWTESRLLAAWVVLCGSLFAGIALYADVLHKGVQRIASGIRGVVERSAAARADAQFLAAAQNDPRVMHELRVAIMRHNAVADAAALAGPSEEVQSPTLYQAMRLLNAPRYP